MKFDLKNQKISIFGIQGSGKTYLVKYILEKRYFKKTLIYRVNDDYDDIKSNKVDLYFPNDFLNDLEKVCLWIKENPNVYDCLVIDESDLFFRSNYDISPSLHYLILNHRHLNLSIIFVSRRPQDIPTKIIESCFHIFIFKIEGDNVIKKFKNIHSKIPTLIEKLEYTRHNFIYKALGKEPVLMQPISI